MRNASDDDVVPVKHLIHTIANDFKTRWGSANTPKYVGSVVRGFRRRQVGIHPMVSIATALGCLQVLCRFAC